MTWVALMLPASAFTAPKLLDSIIVVVNNRIVTLGQYQRFVNNLVEINKNILTGKKEEVREKILDALILETLQIHAANQAGIRFDDIQFNELLRSIARDKNMTVAEHKKLIEKMGKSWDVYLESIRKKVTLEQAYRYIVADNIEITDREIASYVSKYNKFENIDKKYELNHIFLSFSGNNDQLNRQKVKKRMAELRKEIINGKAFERVASQHSMAPDALSGGYFGIKNTNELPINYLNAVVSMKVGEVSAPILGEYGYHLIKLKAVKNSIQKRLTKQFKLKHILIRKDSNNSLRLTKKLVEGLHKRIKAGEDFSVLASHHSQDISTAGLGGDIGWTSLADLPAEVSREVDKLKIGESTDMIETKYGFHIFQLNGIKKVDRSNIDLKLQAKNNLVRARLGEAIERWQKSLIDSALIEYKNLDSLSHIIDKEYP